MDDFDSDDDRSQDEIQIVSESLVETARPHNPEPRPTNTTVKQVKLINLGDTSSSSQSLSQAKANDSKTVYYQTQNKQAPRTPVSQGGTPKYQSGPKTNISSECESEGAKFKDPHVVIDKYANLPFMPQKNEQTDRRDILMRSKEFNPLVSFPVQEKKKAPPKTKNKPSISQPLKKSYVD